MDTFKLFVKMRDFFFFPNGNILFKNYFNGVKLKFFYGVKVTDVHGFIMLINTMLYLHNASLHVPKTLRNINSLLKYTSESV